MLRPTIGPCSFVLWLGCAACGGQAPPAVKAPTARMDSSNEPTRIALPGGALRERALTADGYVHVVVEIPAGTNAKWEMTRDGSAIEWELQDGAPRVVQYLAYPANYGAIPRTLQARQEGGDGDPLDVLVLGPTLPRGHVTAVRPIGVLRLLDGGERDDKILAVQLAGPLSDLRDVKELEERYAGALKIVELWFTHYKGPGRLQSQGIAGAEVAVATIREASNAFERSAR